MYRPCLHCDGKEYDKDYCPSICTYGEAQKRIEDLETELKDKQLQYTNSVSKENAMDLVSRLRKKGLSNGSSFGQHSGLFDEAADMIETLLGCNASAPCSGEKEFYAALVGRARERKKP